MKKLNLFIAITIIMQLFCFGQNEANLRKELEKLKPLLGKTWTSEMKDPSRQKTLHLTSTYEVMHGGKILKYHQECKELNVQTDGYFYYDPDKKEIAYLTLKSNGNITIGKVKEENGNLLLYGHVIFSDRKLEFRNTYEITTKGEIIDKYFRFERGEWRAGHSRVWTVK